MEPPGKPRALWSGPGGALAGLCSAAQLKTGEEDLGITDWMLFLLPCSVMCICEYISACEVV